MAVMSILYESSCDNNIFRAPDRYNDNAFQEPTLKSFNPLRCRPWQIGPVFAPFDFVTIFLTGVELSALCPTPSNPGGPMFFCRGCLP